MRTKSGSPGNIPGEVSSTKTAEPSSSELMPTRIAISQKSLRRRSRSATPCSLRQLRDQVEDRQIHRDDDAADDTTEERDHDRLEQRQQARNGGVDFFFVKIRNLRKHRVERAGRFADGNHLRDHRRKDA